MQPGAPLVGAVRAGLILKGTSFHAHCKEIGVDSSYARKVLMGRYNSPAGMELIAKLMAAADVAAPASKDCENERSVA